MSIMLSESEYNRLANKGLGSKAVSSLPMRAVKNQLKGKKNRKSGLSFEAEIEKACEYYATHNLAYIEKTPEPMRVIGTIDGTKGLFKAVFEKKAQPDFKGVLLNGRCILFEAKHTIKRSISFDAITKTQFEKLSQYAKLGALCFVLVSFDTKTGENHYYRIPWDVWSNMKNIYGHGHLSEKEICEYQIPYNEGCIKFLDL